MSVLSVECIIYFNGSHINMDLYVYMNGGIVIYDTVLKIIVTTSLW